jgi:phage-related protein
MIGGKVRLMDDPQQRPWLLLVTLGEGYQQPTAVTGINHELSRASI